jgi:hypothetical protein
MYKFLKNFQMISFWVSTTPSQQIIEPNTVFMTETNQNVWNMANGIPPLGIFVNHSRSGNFMATLKETEDKRKILHVYFFLLFIFHQKLNFHTIYCFFFCIYHS